MKKFEFGQDELKHVYDSAKRRCDAHPEKAEKYRKLLEKVPVYKDKSEAIKQAIAASKENDKNGQVWAQIGRDEEFFFIQDHYIASADWKVWHAAEYIGMEQVFTIY